MSDVNAASAAAAAPATSASSTVAAGSDGAVVAQAPLPTRDPNFSGSWRSVSHDNIGPLLRAQGFSERNADMAAKAVVTQHIKHTRNELVVEVSGMVTPYSIVGGHLESAEEDAAADAAEEAKAVAAGDGTAHTAEDLSAALLQQSAEWVGTRRRRLESSTGDIDTSRELLDQDTMLVETTAHTEQGNITAKTTFKRIPAQEQASASACSTSADKL